MKTRPRSPIPFLLVLALALILGGCQMLGGGGTPAPTLDASAQLTEAASTIVAELTLAAPDASPTPEAPSPAEPTELLPPTEAPPPPTNTPEIVEMPTQTNTPLPTEELIPTETNVPLETPTATATLAPTAPAGGAGDDYLVEFLDDFSGQFGWFTAREDDFSMRFNLGGYLMWTRIRNDAIWSVRSQGYNDVRVEVDAARRSGPITGYYGVTCRFLNGSNYYALVISSDGGYAILKQQIGTLTPLLQSTTPSPAIIAGDNINTVRADCIGSSLTLFVNGEQVATVQDTSFASGQVGMVIGAYGQTDLEVLFDNFTVFTPQGATP